MPTLKIENTKVLKIINPINLNEIARKEKCNVDILHKCNPHIKTTSETIQYRKIYLPVSILTNSSLKKVDDSKYEKVITDHNLRLLFSKIKPKLTVLLNEYYLFDKKTDIIIEKLENKIESSSHLPEVEKKYFTHKNIFNEKEFKFIGKYLTYIEYKKNIYKKYEESFKKMGLFLRNLFHLLYLIEYPEHFQGMFRLKDNKKFKDALTFTNRYLNTVLSKAPYYFYYILHQYEKLTATYMDWVFYENIAELVNSTFGIMYKYFSNKGRIQEWVINYKAFYNMGKIEEVLKMYVSSSTNAMVKKRRNINDEYIFNYSNPYKNLLDEQAINKKRDELEDSTIDTMKTLYKDDETQLEKARFFHSEFYLDNMENLLNESKERVNSFTEDIKQKKGHLVQFAKFINYFYDIDHDIHVLYCEAKNFLKKTKELVKSKSSIDNEIKKAFYKLKALYYAYLTSASLLFIAGQVGSEIDWLESVFTKEEDFYDYISATIFHLSELAKENDPENLWEVLTHINDDKRWEELIEWAKKLVKTANTAGFVIELVALLVISIILSIVITPFGAGFIAGFLGVSKATAITIMIFAESLIFTVSYEGFLTFKEGKKFFDGSFKNFLFAYTTNTVMFFVFRGIGKCMRVLDNVIKNKILLFLTKSMINFLSSTLITSPFFLAQLIASGKHPLSWKEWLRFITIQAIFSTIFSLSSTMHGKIEKFEKALFKSGYKAGKTVKWQWNVHRLNGYLDTTIGELNSVKKEIEKFKDVEIFLLEKDGKYKKYDLKRMREGITDSKKIIVKFKNISRYYKTMNKTLKKINVCVKKGELNHIDIDLYDEIVSLDYLINQSETMIDQIKLLKDKNNMLGCNISEASEILKVGKYSYGDIADIYIKKTDIQNIDGQIVRLTDYKTFSNRLNKEIILAAVYFKSGNKKGLASIPIIDTKGEVYLPQSILDQISQIPENELIFNEFDNLINDFPWKKIFDIDIPSLSDINTFANDLNDPFVNKLLSNADIKKNITKAAGRRTLIDYDGTPGSLKVNNDFLKDLFKALEDPKKIGYTKKLTKENVTNAMQIALYTYDPYTANIHSKNVANLAKNFAKCINNTYNQLHSKMKKGIKLKGDELKSYNFCKKYRFSEKDIDKLYYAGLLHDTGKMGTPTEILQKGKGDPFSKEERQIVKWYPEITNEMLTKVNSSSGKTLDHDIILWASRHHEGEFANFGYPNTDKNRYDELTIFDAIIKASDILSALGDEGRPYKDAMKNFVKMVDIIEEHLKSIKADYKTGKVIEYPDPSRNTASREFIEEFYRNENLQNIVKSYYKLDHKGKLVPNY